MRVIQLSHLYPRTQPHKDNFGGIQRNAQYCAEALASAGYGVAALAANDAPQRLDDVVNGIPVRRSPSYGMLASQPLTPFMFADLAALRPDIVHFHAPNPLGVEACLAAGRTTRFVVTHHLDITRQKLLKRLAVPRYRELLRRSEKIIVYTGRYAEHSTELHGFMDKVVVVPHALRSAKYAVRPDDTDEHLGIWAEARLRVAYLGRLVPHKGIEDLLAACAKVPGAFLRIVGDGPLSAAVAIQAESGPLKGRVEILGHVSEADKIRFLHGMDVLVLPARTRAEAFGQVLVEAHLSGKACITTECGAGMSEIVEDGESGLVVPPSDVEALAAALGSLVDDPARVATMGRYGRRRALERYTDEVVRARLVEVFGSL